MVQQYEHWAELNLGSGKYDAFIFNVGKEQTDYQLTIKSNVTGTGLDLGYYLCNYHDYTLYRDWKKHPSMYKLDEQGNKIKDSSGYPVIIQRPFPNIQFFLQLRTNQIDKSFSFYPGNYVLICDNSYSTIKPKHVWLHFIESWDHDTSSIDLPLIEQLVDEVPTDVISCLSDANNSYKVGHYNQCSIMLRKSIEIACKIKLLQAKTKPSQLIDNDGYEISLSKKIRLLQKKNLITQKSIKDIEHVKWFGDQSAHSTMKITMDDIRDSIEPRIRSFLVGLNLKI